MGNFYYGGQAVIEGVMMRGQKIMAVAVRGPDGKIVVHEEPLEAAIYRKSWGSWPFVRGVRMLWDALGLGMRALLWSADVSLSDEPDIKFSGPVAWTTIASSLAIAIGVFFLLPTFAGKWLSPKGAGGLVVSLVEGVFRLALFLFYLWGIGKMPDIRRVFGYHGAEHKTINAYEAGAPLTPESVARFSTAHTRCGTGFLLSVMVIAIVVFAPFHFDNVLLRLASRLLLIPVVAGIAYEFLRFTAARYSLAVGTSADCTAVGLAASDNPRARRRDAELRDCSFATRIGCRWAGACSGCQLRRYRHACSAGTRCSD